ncbi:MAG: SDR family oxidoreductase [Rhodanobacteraceae bacterium]
MSQRTAIITGAGGALASHLIETFQHAGWKLALAAYDDSEAERLHQHHPDSLVVKADLADASSAHSAMEQASAALGQVDCLLNIAGGFGMSSAVNTSPDELENQLSINFRSAFNATRAVLPGMLERGRGFILGVGAAAAIDGGAGMGAYAASKAALITWLKSLRQEVAGKGVDVAIVYPMAAIDTPGNRKAMPGVDPDTWIDPDELAATIMHLATRSPRGRILESRVYPPA